jgi:lipopolysaccharide export system protein LptA
MKFSGLVSFCLFITSISVLTAQPEDNRIELLGARSLKFEKSFGVDAQRLIGNVKFKHKGAYMYCDSAYLYNESNSLDAFGNVRIVQGDSLTMTSETLFYDGNTEYVKVRNKVVLRDKDMVLKTNILDYDRVASLAIFYDRGTITSQSNENKLISCEGIYNSKTEFFFFRDSVILKNPKYTVETDTLNFDNFNEIAYFKGPTFIYSDANTIYCENGWYDTKKDLSQFNQNAYMISDNQTLRGDSLFYDRNKGLGKAFENVSLTDTLEKIILNGDYGIYNEQTGKNLMTGRAEMIQYDALDSLFLHGDTLLAIKDSIGGDKIFAYPRVKFFRKDIQGAADSLVYSKIDSTISMYRNPVLWSEDLQITGDTIDLKTYNGEIQNLFVYENAFMINQIDTIKYNQIKGKHLTGFFQHNDLYKVFIKGNGQSLYYAAEESESEESLDVDSIPTEKPEPVLTYIGVNKAICSDIAIYLNENKVKRIVFLKKPDGVFYPIEKLSEEDYYFDSFEWFGKRRPENRRDIFEFELPEITEETGSSATFREE